LCCAAAALVVAFFALIPPLNVAGDHPSALVRIDADQPVAALVRSVDPGFTFVDPEGRYAGVYAYAIARDPLALGEAHRLIDDGAAHYAQPGYGWLAALLSAGQARALPVALIALNVVALVVAAFSVSTLSRSLGRSGWWGALVFLNPGFIFGVSADTPEPLVIAATSLGLLCWLRGSRMAGWLLAAACFVSQAGLAVAAGLALFELVRGMRIPPPQGESAAPRPALGLVGAASRIDWRSLAVLLAGPALYLAWSLYLLARFQSWPLAVPLAVYVPPFGLIAALGHAGSMAFAGPVETHIANGDEPILGVVAALLVLSIVRSWRSRTPLEAVALVTALAALVLISPRVLDPRELFRFFAAPLAFVALGALAQKPEAESETRLAGAPIAGLPQLDAGSP